jgi:hypothetical protein
VKTEVKVIDGVPRFLIDGEPHHGIFSSARAKYMGNMLDAGFDIIDTHPNIDLGWVGPGEFDYGLTDAKIDAYLSQDARAKLILRFWPGFNRKWGAADLEDPEHSESGQEPAVGDFWWARENPGELVTDEFGTPRRPLNASFASSKFRTEVAVALTRLVAHIEEKYGDRIAAYMTGSGLYGESLHWLEQDARMVDQSPTLRRAFAEYVRDKYGHIAALNGTWHANYEGFDSVPLASYEERSQATYGMLRSIPREQRIIDFYELLNHLVADTVLEWSKAVKAACHRTKAVIVFYGYVWSTSAAHTSARRGHMEFPRILRSPDIDAIAAPFTYHFRQLDGVISSQSVVHSVHRSGKLFIHELDGSTDLMPIWNCPFHHNPSTADETRQLLRRELGRMLCEGSSGWYMDLFGGGYDGAELVSVLSETRQMGARYRMKTGVSNRQVAAVLDPRAYYYCRDGAQMEILSPMLSMFRQFELERMGLGYDDFLIDDLLALEPEQTEQYKFWIFPFLPLVSKEMLQSLRRHVFRNNNTVLWTYAPACLSSAGIDTGRMKEVTGFECGYALEPGEISVVVEAGAYPVLGQVEKRIQYGTYGDLSPDYIKFHASKMTYPRAVWQDHKSPGEGFDAAPRFYIKSGGEVLGRTGDLAGSPVGLAARDMGSWVSVFSVAPAVSRHLLRKMASSAGCHVYSDFPGQTYQCQGYVGMFFHADGTCRIDLPGQAAAVKEVYSDIVVAKDTDVVELDARKNHAVLLEIS